jgi:hypothetical protein
MTIIRNLNLSFEIELAGGRPCEVQKLNATDGYEWLADLD